MSLLEYWYLKSHFLLNPALKDFDDTKSCIDVLRKDGYKIWATDLGQVAACLTEEELRGRLQPENGNVIPDKVAIVFGTEAVGCTTEMLNAADLRVYLPLRGFADSLNLSVATALIVHQMFVLDPTLVGGMSEEERRELRKSWYAKLASQRLLSSRTKKSRTKLLSFLHACGELEKKQKAGVKLEGDALLKVRYLYTILFICLVFFVCVECWNKRSVFACLYESKHPI